MGLLLKYLQRLVPGGDANPEPEKCRCTRDLVIEGGENAGVVGLINTTQKFSSFSETLPILTGKL